MPLPSNYLPSAGPVFGRSRWMPDGRAVVFVGANEEGVTGLYVQEFGPGRAAPRPLVGFDAEAATESFGISPDGSRAAIAGWEQLFSLMVADNLPGVSPPERSRF